MTIKIITDSAADISPEVASDLGITVIPINIKFGEEVYQHGVTITNDEFYQKLADELKGIARASLVSATEISSETIEKIRTTLSKRTGKDIILKVEHDPGLIGGIVSRIGDLVLDGSIKTQLLNMRESLKRGESA